MGLLKAWICCGFGNRHDPINFGKVVSSLKIQRSKSVVALMNFMITGLLWFAMMIAHRNIIRDVLVSTVLSSTKANVSVQTA
jgi:hypothetical protein